MHETKLRHRIALRFSTCALIAVGLTWGHSIAQDGGDRGEEDEHFPTMEELLNGGAGGGAQESPEARMRRLFGEVETKLKEVDVLLVDAAAGDTSRLVQVDDAGISRLLRNSLERGRSAQNDIGEILEIARQLSSQPQPGASGGQAQPSNEGPPQGQDSPLNQGNQNQRPESTPELPGQDPGGQQPQGQEQGQQDGQQQGPAPRPEQGGTDPKNPDGDPKADGENKSGNERDDGAAGNGSRGNGDDGWGNLPSHVRDTFRSEGRSELPARYRDWIDEYYKKLNKRGSRR
jgi:hypothetical protein